MGIPVIYCAKCQEMIPARDITDSKMLTAGSRNYCYKCSVLIKGASSQAKPIVTNAPVRTPVKTSPNQISSLRPSTIKPGAVSSVRRPAQQRVVSPASKFQRPQRSSFRTATEDEDVFSPQKASSNKYIIGGIIGGVIILIILIIIISSSGSDKPSGKPNKTTKTQPKSTKTELSKEEQIAKEKKAEEERLAKAKKAFEEITDYEKGNPLDYKEITQKIGKSFSIVANTDYENQLREKQTEYREKTKTMNDTNDWLESYNKNPSDYAGYISAFNKLRDKAKDIKNSDALIGFIEEQINKLKETLNNEAKKELDKLKTDVEDLKNRNLYEDAIALCESFPEDLTKDSYVASEITRLKEEIEKAKADHLKKKKEEGLVIFGPDRQDTDQWWSFSFLGAAPKLDVKDNVLVLEDTTQDNGRLQQLPFGSCVCFGESSWTDYTVELEYKVVQGAANLALRFDYQPIKDAQQRGGGNTQFILPYKLPLQRKFGSDKWEKITIVLRDNNLTIKEEGKPERKEEMPAQNKSGGVGFLLRPGDKILIKSIRIKGVD